MREHLGMVFVPAEPLDPLAGQPVLLSSPGTRNLAVGDISNEQVQEGVLALARHRGPPLATDELLSLQVVQGLLRGRPLHACDAGGGTQPEDLADHRSVLKQGLLLVGKRIEPGGDDSLHRLGQRQLLAAGDQLAVGHHANKLLRVQRVPTGSLEKSGLRLRGQDGPLEESREEARRLVVVERRQGERGRVRLPPPQPARRASSSGRAVHTTRIGTSGPVDQVVDEVEKPLVRPVEILEDKDEWALFGDALEEPPPGGERLRPLISVQLLLALDSDERAEVPLDPLGCREVARGRSVSFSSVSSGESVSRIPACALTISPSAQYETPSPYGSERPWRQ